MKVKKVSKPTLECDTYLIAQAVNQNAEVLEGALNRIKELEKRMTKEETAGKPIEIEEFIKSEDMTREEAIDLVRTAFMIWEDEYDTGEDWSAEHKARDAAIKALKQDSIIDKVKQAREEMDKLASHKVKPISFDQAVAIDMCIKIIDKLIKEVEE